MVGATAGEGVVIVPCSSLHPCAGSRADFKEGVTSLTQRCNCVVYTGLKAHTSMPVVGLDTRTDGQLEVAYNVCVISIKYKKAK